LGPGLLGQLGGVPDVVEVAMGDQNGVQGLRVIDLRRARVVEPGIDGDAGAGFAAAGTAAGADAAAGLAGAGAGLSAAVAKDPAKAKQMAASGNKIFF